MIDPYKECPNKDDYPTWFKARHLVSTLGMDLISPTLPANNEPPIFHKSYSRWGAWGKETIQITEQEFLSLTLEGLGKLFNERQEDALEKLRTDHRRPKEGVEIG